MAWFKAALAVVFLGAMAPAAHAEIDGHGPDSWRVTNVRVGEVLNARMGPGTNYPVIETFADYERGLQQITCVPFYTAAHFMAMSETEIASLPQRWCLMRDAAMRKAGWVAQHYITPDNAETLTVTPATAPAAPPATEPYAPDPNIDPVDQATDLVREIYERQFQSENSNLPSAFDPSVSHHYFTNDIVAWLASGDIGAHPLYGAQDFDGAIGEPTPDPDQPMFRGMITINVDFTNFGQPQRAVFYLRADTERARAPLRVFRIEHDGWSLP
ncbi:SH3 domain-containing protein [Devosia sp. A449]